PKVLLLKVSDPAKVASVPVVGKVNVDDQQEIAAQYGIRNIPTILFFKNGEMVDKNVGVAPKADLAKKIDALI
ncbi:MAG: thioredoxin domain-containing protein, partial [Flavobacteriales bacterium]|nr:thioredoxin domain-containing protein [Flavobacteriales bacterium]